MDIDELMEKANVAPELRHDPVFRRVMEDSLGIQDRFAAEPVYAKTGKGYLKSVGVSEIEEAKRSMRVAEDDS